MSGLARVLAVIGSTLVVASCGANFSTAYRTYSVEGTSGEPTRPQSIVIDAKQRAILAAPVDRNRIGAGASARDVFICAEPSPDALSAISASFAGSFGGIFGPGEEVQAALASSFSETAAQLGVRNATIQLLRDGLYRQCEAYMNGLIDKPYYEQIANKYVNAMLILLATEELTPSKARALRISAAEGAKVSADTNIEVNAPAPPEDAEEPPATPPENPPQEDAETPEESQRDTGTTTASAESPAPTVGVNLPDEGGTVEEHVSTAVNTMVTWFLTKDTVDYCLRGLFAGATPTGNSLHMGFVDVCQHVIRAQMAQQGEVAAAFSASVIVQSGGETGDCAKAIKEFWMPGGEFSDQNEERIENAISELGLGVEIPDLLSLRQFATEAFKVGSRLGLSDCMAGG